MCYLLIRFSLAHSFVLLTAILELSLGSCDSSSFSNEVPENFNEAFLASSEPVPVLDADDLFFDNNNEYLVDALSTTSRDSDSLMTDDLFAIANNEQQSDGCFSSFILSSPPSRFRSKRAEEVCHNPDESGTDAPVLGLIEQIKKMWCSKSAVEGFPNIPVCKTNEPDISDFASIWSSPEFPSYQPAVPLPGSIQLRQCKLSKSHYMKAVVAFIFSHLFPQFFYIIMVKNLTMLICSDVVGRLFLFSSGCFLLRSLSSPPTRKCFLVLIRRFQLMIDLFSRCTRITVLDIGACQVIGRHFDGYSFS